MANQVQHYLRAVAYLTPDEAEALRELADQVDVSDSAYLRMLIRREAEAVTI